MDHSIENVKTKTTIKLSKEKQDLFANTLAVKNLNVNDIMKGPTCRLSASVFQDVDLASSYIQVFQPVRPFMG